MHSVHGEMWKRSFILSMSVFGSFQVAVIPSPRSHVLSITALLCFPLRLTGLSLEGLPLWG